MNDNGAGSGHRDGGPNEAQRETGKRNPTNGATCPVRLKLPIQEMKIERNAQQQNVLQPLHRQQIVLVQLIALTISFVVVPLGA